MTFFSSGAFSSEIIYTRAPTDLIEDGKSISLEIIIYKPPGSGPFPTLMFNHGSTGTGANPAYFKTSYAATSLAFYFNKQGWLVAFPQRRGRGRSDGFYNEGLEPNRSGYSCTPEIAFRGIERALQDLEEAVKYLKNRPDVDSRRMLIGGQSRGGILSISYAGIHPNHFIGAINFVGGWVGQRCVDMEAINTTTFARGASFRKPTLWLYGENDSTYELAHTRKYFDAFADAGGKGLFLTFSLKAGVDGHRLVYNPESWWKAMDSFIQGLTTVSN
jgi:dienelactone hydrolase